MDTTTRLIWFFDHFNPYFQCGYAVLSVICAGLCFWSAYRHPRPGIILLGIVCVLAIIQNILFAISAFQEGKPFLGFLPLELRKQAYLCGRLLGVPSAILFPITVVVIALEAMQRHQKT